MNTQNLNICLTESRRCAMTMMEAAAYIQRELPNVKMSDAHRELATEVCSKLIETKHDVIDELSELNREADSLEAEMIAKSIHMILRWLGEGLHEIRALADELQTAANEDPGGMTAFILVAENFINISTPFGRAHDAAQPLIGDTGS